MAVKALLLDKDREIFPLLGDIFNVTGHKLLIAANEKMFSDLIYSTDVDIVMINHADVKAWLNAWKEDKIALPFFFIDREEEERKLRSVGFSELNFIRKPFNPLELLNRLSYLHKLGPEEASQLGLLNTLIKLSNSKKTVLVEVSDSTDCNILMYEGKILGLDCTLDGILSILESESVSVNVKDYEEIELEQRFKDTKDFIQNLIEKAKPIRVVLSEGEKVLKEFKPVEEVEENLYRVSKFASVPVLLKNVYLRIYEGRDKRVALLINIGTLDEWSSVRNLVEDTLFSLESLDAVILLTGELASLYNTFILSEQKTKVQFITDYSVKRCLSESGCKSGRIRTFEDFPSYNVTIATGHRLRFIPVNFSPSVGGFCLYEEETGYLFTPELFSSLFNEKSTNLKEEIRLYHRIYMPCGDVLNSLMNRFADVKVSTVLPRYGLPYSDFVDTVNTLRDIKTGLDFMPVSRREYALEILNKALIYVMNNEEKNIADKFAEDLGRFSTVEGGKVTDLYVEPPFTVELLLNALVTVPGIKPSTIVGVLRELDKAEVFINPL